MRYVISIPSLGIKCATGATPVAVLVAATPEAAEAALPLINVEYEALPAVLDSRDAVRDGAPLIHESLAEYHRDTAIHAVSDSNICRHYQLRRGDVDSAFAEAHLVVENEYWVPWIAHVQLEPHGGGRAMGWGYLHHLVQFPVPLLHP